MKVLKNFPRCLLVGLLVCCLAFPLFPSRVSAAIQEINLDDGDLDLIYFTGDTIALEFHNFPEEEPIFVSFWVEEFDGEPMYTWPVIEGLTHNPLWGWHVEVVTDVTGYARLEGTIAADVPFTELFVRVNWEIYLLTFGENMYVGIPLTWGAFNVNFDEIDDLYDPDSQVMFTVPGIGSITFDSGIEPVGYIEGLMEAGNDWLSIEFDSTKKQFVVSVDTVVAEPLAEQGATIRLFDLADTLGVSGINEDNFLDYLEFKVYDNDGVLVPDFSDYFDLDNVVYDGDSDTLIIPVNHFSDYIIGLGDILPVTGTNLHWYIVLAFFLIASGAWIIMTRPRGRTIL